MSQVESGALRGSRCARSAFGRAASLLTLLCAGLSAAAAAPGDRLPGRSPEAGWPPANAVLAHRVTAFLCPPRFVYRSLQKEASCASSRQLEAGTRVRVVGIEVPPDPRSVRVQWQGGGHVFSGWIVGVPEDVVVADDPSRFFLPDLPPDEKLLAALSGTWQIDAVALGKHRPWHTLESGRLTLERGRRQGLLTGVFTHVHDLQRRPGGSVDRRMLWPDQDRLVEIEVPFEATLSGDILTIVSGRPRMRTVSILRTSWTSDHFVLRVGNGVLEGVTWHELHDHDQTPVRFERPTDMGGMPGSGSGAPDRS